MAGRGFWDTIWHGLEGAISGDDVAGPQPAEWWLLQIPMKQFDVNVGEASLCHVKEHVDLGEYPEFTEFKPETVWHMFFELCRQKDPDWMRMASIVKLDCYRDKLALLTLFVMQQDTDETRQCQLSGMLGRNKSASDG